MKLIAFYATGLTLLCVMIFGGIEGFSFKINVVNKGYIYQTEETDFADLIFGNRSHSKQIKFNHEADHQGLKGRIRTDYRISSYLSSNSLGVPNCKFFQLL